MAEIRKKYPTKFPREVIEEAHRLFKEHLEEDAKLGFAEWHITRGNEQLTLDSDNEFYYGYRNDIDEASLNYTYDSSKIYKFFLSYSKRLKDRDHNIFVEESNILISLKTQEDVKLVFNIFDKNYIPVETSSNELSKDAPKSKYSVEKQIPSCHVDRNLIEKLQNYLEKVAQENNLPKLVIKIIDSSGTEELPDITNFASDYFPNDVRNISINCSNYDSKLSVSFDRKKEKSKLELSIKGDQAREKASRVNTDIMRMIDEYKNKNYIYHLIPTSSTIFLTWMAIAVGMIFVGKTHFFQTYLKIAGIILSMEMAYAIFSHWNTYTTFRTKNYESFIGRKNWLTLALIEFLLFGVLGVVILNQIGL